MSEFTRAQLRQLIKHAEHVIRRSQELRVRLDAVLRQIDQTGTAERPVENRENAPKQKVHL